MTGLAFSCYIAVFGYDMKPTKQNKRKLKQMDEKTKLDLHLH